MQTLYPLKFKPIFLDKIWGGDRIKTVLDLDFAPLPNCGEVWALSGVKANQSIVENGFLAGNELNELIEIYMDDLVGGDVYQKYGNEFPILIKFIDANDYLSIQVHPDDELANIRHEGSGKTEMWYIIKAEKDAELISGFNKKMDQEKYLDHLKKKSLKDILNIEKVKAGDVFYIPSGRVHALGPGILLTEIQQTSDLTYRIYDWDRVDDKGQSRELHTAMALDAIDFDFYKDYKTNYDKKVNQTVQLVESPYFNTNLLDFSKPLIKDYSELDSFVIYICPDGDIDIKYPGGIIGLKTGESLLIPAELTEIQLFPQRKSKILEVYIT